MLVVDCDWRGGTRISRKMDNLRLNFMIHLLDRSEQVSHKLRHGVTRDSLRCGLHFANKKNSASGQVA